MKKLFYTISLLVCVFILTGSSIASATEMVAEDYSKKITNIQENADVMQNNIARENYTILSLSDINELKKDSIVEIEKIDNKFVEIKVKNIKPEKIVTFDDGTTEEYHSQSVILCCGESRK